MPPAIFNSFHENTIRDVVYDKPVTVVNWTDGSVTTAMCKKEDIYNYETGLAVCIIKRMLRQSKQLQ